MSCLNNAVFTDSVSLASLQVMSPFIQVALHLLFLKLKHAINPCKVTSQLALYNQQPNPVWSHIHII